MKKLILQLGVNPSKILGLLLASLAANLLALVPAVFVILVLNRYVTYGVDATLVTLAARFIAITRKEKLVRSGICGTSGRP